MTRTKIFIAALTAAIAFPVAASAHCGTTQGSFAVTCEKGVQVYRHQALSGIPKGLSPAQAKIKSEEIRAETARRQIASQASAARVNAKLRERELAIADYRARVYDRNTRGNSTYFIRGNAFRGGFRGGLNNRTRRRSAFRQK